MIFLSLYGKGQALQVTGGTVRYTGIPSLRLKTLTYGISVLVHAGWR